jgi:hypothetical protein
MLDQKTIDMVFNQMAIICKIKQAEGKKMVTSTEITQSLRDHQNLASKILVDACLDILIQQRKVWYFDNERRYRYYAITPFGWDRWEKSNVG